jgi:alpha-ribazole phosphatase
VCYGSTDLDVTTESLAQAVQTATNNVPPVWTWVASPLLRARRLADALLASPTFANTPDLTLTTDVRLCEMDFGDWEMQTYAELGSHDAFKEWGENYMYVRTPGGESFADVYDRVVSFVSELRPADSTAMAVVAHSGVIRSWLAYALGLPVENAFRIDVGYGGVVHLWMDQDPRLNRLLALAETDSHTGER